MAQLREGSVIKKVGGDEVIATVNDIPEIPTSLPANGGDADTIGGFTVGVDVPSNAKFTDTVTTINGKAGAISKADIVALGIPSSDTVYVHPTTHSADMIVDGSTNKAFTATEKTKLAGVATGANKYTHPANHPPSIITQDANNRFVTDTEKAAWSGKADKTYVDNKVKTDVPSNAKFTDTIVDISGKQDKLTAGDNIIITSNTISATDTVYDDTSIQTELGKKADKTELHNHTNKLTLDKFLETNGELYYNNKQLATIDNVVWDNIEGRPTIISGVSFFAGSSNEVIIPHNLSTTPTVVYAHPTTNPQGYLGEVWIRTDEVNIYVGNSGSYSGEMSWTVIV